MAWDPHGCHIARKATWQHHADPRERLRGTNVVRMRGRATWVPAWHLLGARNSLRVGR